MMIKKSKSKKGSLNLFFFVVVFMVIEYLLLGSYAVYDVSLNCPGYANLEANYNVEPNTPYNLTNGTGGTFADTSPWWDPFGVVSWLGNGVNFVTLLFGGCTGLPWQLYLLGFGIPMLIIGIYLYQLVRSGG
jgi:hypothetical protein